MATLYVENVPDELYEALRNRAKQNRKSIAGEVISLLEENVPTPQELKRRQRCFSRFSSCGPRNRLPMPAASRPPKRCNARTARVEACHRRERGGQMVSAR